MVTIRLKAGMGNQMFQYAFGLRMARALGVDLRIDLSLLLDRARGDKHVYRNYDLTIFNVSHDFTINPSILKTLYKTKSSKISKLTRKWIGRNKNYIKEPHFHVSQDILNHPKDNTIYEGWWQSEDYFSEIAAEVKDVFSFIDPIQKDSKELLHKLQNSNSVCLNVRRTDFLKVDTLNTTNEKYFFRAAKYIAERVENPVFYIFSDDVEWCRDNIRLDYPTEVIGHEHKGRKFGNYMQLMIACQHFIIPNSSYAWWAVWLNANPSKLVVAPKVWFNDSEIDTSDLVPKEWMRL
ncbi:MAG: alpha-1,2-fucosyltransferase [Saprospiraceae bacterium]